MRNGTWPLLIGQKTPYFEAPDGSAGVAAETGVDAVGAAGDGGQAPNAGASTDADGSEGRKSGEQGRLLATGELPPSDPEKPDAGETSESGGEEGGGTDTPADPADTVPEDGVYNFEIGDDLEVDTELAASVSPVLKELGLTRRQANQLANVFAQYQREQAEAQQKTLQETLTGWVKEAAADPTYRTVGFDNAINIADRALRTYGDEEVQQVLRMSGLNNHPAMIRLLYKAGTTLREDTSQGGPGAAGGAEEPAERRLYGKTTPETKRR